MTSWNKRFHRHLTTVITTEVNYFLVSLVDMVAITTINGITSQTTNVWSIVVPSPVSSRGQWWELWKGSDSSALPRNPQCRHQTWAGLSSPRICPFPVHKMEKGGGVWGVGGEKNKPLALRVNIHVLWYTGTPPPPNKKLPSQETISASQDTFCLKGTRGKNKKADSK